MKTSLSTLTSVFLLTIIFFSSCKTSSDVVSNNWIQKRKYTKGYFVANKTPKKNAKEVLTDGEQVNASLSHESITPTIHALPLTPLKEFKPANANSREVRQSDHSVSDQFESRKQFDTNEFNLNELSKLDYLDVEKTTFKPLDGSSKMDDTEFIIILILCFFLPPLAVFLMYDISPQFWLSLLLTILFWVPGVIYAYLLAFDII